MKINQVIADWQKMSGRKLFIRLHPRSTGAFWKELNAEGVEILSPEPFVKSAARASVMIATFTNAVIDAALLRRPSQLISFPEQVDYLHVERYFGPRANTVEDIEAAVSRHLENYSDSLKKCDEFASYHVAQGENSVAYLADCIQKLVEGVDVMPECTLSYDGKFY